jgi:hypothetical protein
LIGNMPMCPPPVDLVDAPLLRGAAAADMLESTEDNTSWPLNSSRKMFWIFKILPLSSSQDSSKVM